MGGWGWSCDGFPYFLTGAQHAAVTSSDSDFSSAWTIARGFLDARTGYEWEERWDAQGRGLEVGSLTFRVSDAAITTGPYANLGAGLATYAFTRDPEGLTRTQLAASVTSVSDVTITVADGAAFGSAPFNIWVYQECLRVTAIA